MTREDEGFVVGMLIALVCLVLGFWAGTQIPKREPELKPVVVTGVPNQPTSDWEEGFWLLAKECSYFDVSDSLAAVTKGPPNLEHLRRQDDPPKRD